MTSESVSTILHRHPFVSGFQPRHVDKLSAMGNIASFKPDEIIFREGEACNKFYLLVSGPVSLELALPRNVIQIQRIGAGDGLGWSAALVGRGKHFQARALDEVEALYFDGPEVLAACREDPEFGFAFMLRLLDVVASRLRATRVQLLDMHSPVARLSGA
jgi:CRP/FNR family cyclic AMP-dependent transcriptional regulator